MSNPIRSVPFDDWPSLWVELKNRARDPKASLHDGSGMAYHWRERTNKGADQALGLWLDFLIRNDLPLRGLTPSETVTRTTLEKYIQELQARETIKSDWTIRNYVRDLGEDIRVMEPDADRSLLKEALSELETLCDPVIDPIVSLVGASDLLDAGIRRMEKFRMKAFDHWRPALAYGDGLMMSMWICKSIRASTFACTQTGINLILANGHYRVHYEVYQNKTRVVIDADIATELTEYIEEWDAIKQATLIIKCVGDGINRISETQSVRPLWVTRTGQQMSGRQIFSRFCRATEDELNVRINPQRVRRISATSVAFHLPDPIRAIQSQLDHGPTETARRNYIHTGNLPGTQGYMTLLERRRSRIRS